MRRRDLAAVAVGMLLLSNVALVLIGPTPDALAVPGGRGSTARPGSPVGGLSARGSPRSLGSRQWIHTDDAMTFSIDGRPLGAAGTVTISALSQSWANVGRYVPTGGIRRARVPSAALRSAWVEAGLSTTPLAAQASGAGQEHTRRWRFPPGSPRMGLLECSCEAGVLCNFSVHPSIDPGLESSSGPHGQHHVRPGGRSGSYPNPGFERALLLLQLPTLGSTRAFQVHSSMRSSDSRCCGSWPSAQCTWGARHRVRGHEGSGKSVGRLESSIRTAEKLKNVPAGGMYFTVGASAFWNPYAAAHIAVDLTLFAFAGRSPL